jgi:hypothetical protein
MSLKNLTIADVYFGHDKFFFKERKIMKKTMEEKHKNYIFRKFELNYEKL